MNSDAKSVYGLGGAYVYEGLKAVDDIDNCAVLVEFKNGVMGQIETSRNCIYGYHVETEIYGSEGCIRIGTTPYKDRVTYMNTNGVTVQCVEWFFEYWEPTFLAEMQDFVDCIIEDRQPLVGLDDGYKAVEWAYAATDAVKNRRIVYLWTKTYGWRVKTMSNDLLNGKICIVTGGIQGLGKGIALHLAEKGAEGIIICGRHVQNGETSAREI